jgi:hypothetical protein
VAVAVIRQLAVAKWSPPAAVEKKDQWILRCQTRKAPRYACGIRQLGLTFGGIDIANPHPS